MLSFPNEIDLFTTKDENTLIQELQNAVGGSDLIDICERAVAKMIPDRSSELPIRLDYTCRKLGIAVTTVDTESFEGMLERDNNLEPIIKLAARQHPDRRRFTWAHELGHWVIQELLGNTKTTIFRGVPIGNQFVDEEERIADALAAEILMPASITRTMLQKQRISLDSLSRIASNLDVSWQAMMRRVADLARGTILYLEALPGVFDDDRSYAIVDDGWMANKDSKIRCVQNARFSSLIPFIDLADVAAEGIEVRINGSSDIWQFDSRAKFGQLPCLKMLAFNPHADCQSKS